MYETKKQKAMYNNFDYPVGADTRCAPWNEVPREERDFPCQFTQWLTKRTTIESTAYEEDCGRDSDGNFYNNIDTSEINFDEAYEEQHYNILELLDEFVKVLRKIEAHEEGTMTSRKIRNLISECQGWEEDYSQCKEIH